MCYLNITTYWSLTYQSISIFILLISGSLLFVISKSLADIFYKIIILLFGLYLFIPLFSFFYFGIYLGGLVSMFCGFPDPNTTSVKEIYSMRVNGETVQPESYSHYFNPSVKYTFTH